MSLLDTQWTVQRVNERGNRDRERWLMEVAMVEREAEYMPKVKKSKVDFQFCGRDGCDLLLGQQ